MNCPSCKTPLRLEQAAPPPVPSGKRYSSVDELIADLPPEVQEQVERLQDKGFRAAELFREHLGIPAPGPVGSHITSPTKAWSMRMAALEEGHEVAAGLVGTSAGDSSQTQTAPVETHGGAPAPISNPAPADESDGIDPEMELKAIRVAFSQKSEPGEIILVADDESERKDFEEAKFEEWFNGPFMGGPVAASESTWKNDMLQAWQQRAGMAQREQESLITKIADALNRSKQVSIIGDGCCTAERDEWILRNIIIKALGGKEGDVPEGMELIDCDECHGKKLVKLPPICRHCEKRVFRGSYLVTDDGVAFCDYKCKDAFLAGKGGSDE